VTLEQARDFLRRHDRGEKVGFLNWADANARVYYHHTKTNHPGLLTQDAKPRAIVDRPGRTSDQPIKAINPPADPRDPGLASHWAKLDTGKKADKLFARKVANLPGDVTGYFIAADENGNAALYYYEPVQQDPGVVVGSNGVPHRTFDRDRDYYLGLARQGQTARELAGARLKAINKANAAAWEKRLG
jgi:hypothetical protein